MPWNMGHGSHFLSSHESQSKASSRAATAVGRHAPQLIRPLFFFVQLEFYKANNRGCTSISTNQSVNKREKDLGVYKEVPGQSDIKKTDENKSKHETQKQRRLVVTAKCFAVDTCEDDATGVLAVSLPVTQSISIVHRQMPSGGEKRGRGANPSSGVAGGTVAQC